MFLFHVYHVTKPFRSCSELLNVHTSDGLDNHVQRQAKEEPVVENREHLELERLAVAHEVGAN